MMTEQNEMPRIVDEDHREMVELDKESVNVSNNLTPARMSKVKSMAKEQDQIAPTMSMATEAPKAETKSNKKKFDPETITKNKGLYESPKVPMYPSKTASSNPAVLLQKVQAQKLKKEAPKVYNESEDTMSDMDEVEEAPDEKEYIDPKKLKASLAPKNSAMTRQWKPIEANGAAQMPSAHPIKTNGTA